MASDPPERQEDVSGKPTVDPTAHAARELAKKIEKRLPDEPIDRAGLAQFLAQVVTVEIREAYSFHGPMPPPQMLKEYNEALPGLAERIAVRAEKEQQFRHDITREQIADARRGQLFAAIKTYLGQILGFVVSMTAIGGGVWLLATGRSTAGLWAIVSAVAGLVAVFITGKVVEAIRRPAAEANKDEPE
ncbi:MAG TPA: DUF2335 domain-containing protein [Pirellulaceae bacterium]|nr:DUF2335 domain-containing protein [Pirellulaceae bacterium]